MKIKYPALLALLSAPAAQAGELVITGVFDGPLPGGVPKGIELFVTQDIADLATCGIGSANNGGGTDGQEFTFPSGPIAAGSYLYVASESSEFSNFFGFAPTHTSGAANINGDDAIELFCNGNLVDIFGDIDTDGNGQPWEYQDGWAYREVGSVPDATFSLGNWRFSGPNALDGETVNASAANPFPLKAFADGVTGEPGGGTGPVNPEGPCFNCPALAPIADASTFDAGVYYARAMTEVEAGSSASTIKTAINEAISTGHKNLSYSEVWSALTHTDEDPGNGDNVILWYKGTSIAKFSNGSGSQSTDQDNWNREHSWPKSHGFPNQSQEAYTDIHHLRPTDISVNSSRGNLDFDNSDTELAESPSTRVDGDSFEPRNDIKGDVARMMFYMDTRYEGYGEGTPDLVLVDKLSDGSSPELGRLCRLIEWNNGDPVDASEQARNNAIYEYQGNRNPYVDHPEWVSILYQTQACTDLGGEPAPEPGPVPDSAKGSSTLVFINEIHYDNTGGDVGEAIEIAGPAGTDLAGMTLVAYNGNNSGTYSTVELTGVLPNQQVGFGALSFSYPTNGLQNGSPDGIALVAADGTVLQFLSYEGSFDASGGPADAMTSTDIGVGETSSTTVGYSLQLGGSGFRYEDFVWQEAKGNTFGALNTSQTFIAPSPFINEIHYDNAGGDTGEAIEIAGLAGIDLAGMTLVAYNGNNGSLYNTVDLTGVLPNQQGGLGTLSFPISGLQNGGPDGVALIAAGGAVLQFLSYEGSFDASGGPADGMTSTDIGVGETSSTAVGFSLQLTGSGVQYDDFSWEVPTGETFGQVNSNQIFGAGGANGGGDTGGEIVLLGQCNDPATLISAVQSNTDASPLVGQTHIIEGVVTASFVDLNGYFVQEQSADEDGDATTSEGVFVYSPSLALPQTGKIVRVLGEVAESFEKTQLVVTELNPNCGDSSVAATTIYLPFDSAQSPEALEGMLVTNGNELTVTDTYSLGRYGEVKLSSGRLFVPTNLFPAGSPEAIDLAAQNALNQITLDDGVNGQNPETVIYPTGGLSASNTLRGGDTVSAITGVMDYSYGLFRIIPVQAPTFVASNPRSTAPELVSGNLKVASLNVLNLFNGDGLGGGFPTSRGADDAMEYERQLVKTVTALATIDADIIGLMEIENDGFDTNSAIADLVSRLNQQVGADTYAFINGGGEIGTDAIKVAMLYKVATVSPAGPFKILDSSNSIADEKGPLFVDTKNRPAFNQKFALVANGEEIVISVNHLKSKGSSCGIGDDDTTTGQGSCNLTRTRAAEALTTFLAEQYADTATLIIGDLNSYGMEDPILKIQQAGYTNLINYFGGPKAYSYAYAGEYGYLDHALGNNKALSKVVDVTEWHINADEPTVFDYNVEYKSQQQLVDFYAPDAYRMSDHDPVVVSLNFESTSLSGDVNEDGNIDFADYSAILGVLNAVNGDDRFNHAADLDEDGVITFTDVRLWYQIFLSQ
ncbi:MAG: putative extracellular nuclease/endonuclease I [Paraglaciecola sp.]|jgi:predicted extracellular nuclease/endonuclease I